MPPETPAASHPPDPWEHFRRPVGGQVRVVVDESLCVVIEQDRPTQPGHRTERFTVTNVDVLVEALEDARRAVVALDAARGSEAMSLPGMPPGRPTGDLGPAGGR